MTDVEIAAAAAAKAAADKIVADKAAADKIIADKAVADKAVADKIVADKAAADKAAADEAARIAASKLSDTEAELLKENMKSKEKLKKAAEEKAALETQLKAFEGIDPAKAKDLLAAQAKAAEDAIKAETKRLADAGEFDRLKTMITDAHKTEMTAAQKLIKDTSTALDQATKTINDLTVGASFNTSAFVGEELVLTPRVARDVYGANFDVENGSVVAYDKPRGVENRTKLVNGSGEPLGFEDAIKKLVDAAPDKDQLLKSKLKTGANSKTTSDARAAHKSSQNTVGELSGLGAIRHALEKGALKKAK